jgi:hypothetical protein
MTLTLAAALACLVIWIALTFVVPVGLGVVHVLLGAAVVLFIRWWAAKSPR